MGLVAADEETFEDEVAGLAFDFPFEDVEDALVGGWDGLELVSPVTVFLAAGVIDAELDDDVVAVGAAETATASGAPDVVVPSGTTT